MPWRGQPPIATLRAALGRLGNAGFAVEAASRVFRAPAFPPGSGPDYVNAAVQATWKGTPERALAALHAIEAEFGRQRTGRWGPRTLDLDLLALEDTVLPDAAGQAAWMALTPAEQTERSPDRLILPHPRLHERGFVLAPLAEVAPDWRHPILGKTVAEMRDALPPEAFSGIEPA